jgi:hypothetical protein
MCLLLASMIVCAIFELRHGPYRMAFGFSFFSLGLVNAWLAAQFNIKHQRQPETLIRLFPEFPEKPKESPES